MRVLARLRALPDRARGVLWTLLIRMRRGEVGSGLKVGRGARFGSLPHRGWRVGNDCYFGRGVFIEVSPGAAFIVGDGVRVMHYCVIGCIESMHIGDRALVAEHSSVRDHDHGLDGRNIQANPLVSAPVSLGSDTWIGRGCAILRGCDLGECSVVGANSVARGVLPPMGIYVGAPARLVRTRDVD